MPRIRTLKPEYWSHRIMGRLNDTAKCMAIALLNFADDKGFFHADPILVRNFCRPFDDDSTITRRTLDELSRSGWIEIADSDNFEGGVGRIINFTEHQRIDRPNPSKIERYFDSTKIRRVLDDQSTPEGKVSGKGTGKGEDRAGANGSALITVIPETSRDLFVKMRDAFQSKLPTGFPDPRKEIEALEWMSLTCLKTWPMDPTFAAESLMTKFWEMTQTGSAFMKKQPFLPSRMKALFLDVMKACELEAGTSQDLNDVSWMDDEVRT